MTGCSAPDCGQPAVLQWQREATKLEADHAMDLSQDGQQRIFQHQLTHATVHLIQTQQQHADTTAAAAAGDHRAKAILPTLAEHVAAADAAVTVLEQTGPAVIPDPGTVTVAVFGCTSHAVTPDAATWVHQVGCLTNPPGQCTCPAPPPE